MSRPVLRRTILVAALGLVSHVPLIARGQTAFRTFNDPEDSAISFQYPAEYTAKDLGGGTAYSFVSPDRRSSFVFSTECGQGAPDEPLDSLLPKNVAQEVHDGSKLLFQHIDQAGGWFAWSISKSGDYMYTKTLVANGLCAGLIFTSSMADSTEYAATVDSVFSSLVRASGVIASSSTTQPPSSDLSTTPPTPQASAPFTASEPAPSTASAPNIPSGISVTGLLTAAVLVIVSGVLGRTAIRSRGQSRSRTLASGTAAVGVGALAILTWLSRQDTQRTAVSGSINAFEGRFSATRHTSAGGMTATQQVSMEVGGPDASVSFDFTGPTEFGYLHLVTECKARVISATPVRLERPLTCQVRNPANGNTLGKSLHYDIRFDPASDTWGWHEDDGEVMTLPRIASRNESGSIGTPAQASAERSRYAPQFVLPSVSALVGRYRLINVDPSSRSQIVFLPNGYGALKMDAVPGILNFRWLATGDGTRTRMWVYRIGTPDQIAAYGSPGEECGFALLTSNGLQFRCGLASGMAVRVQ